MSNSSSRAITSSTRSRLSASRSSPNLASRTTCEGSTESTSTAHLRKRSNCSSILVVLLFDEGSVSHAQAAIDRNHGTCDVGGIGGGEKGHDTRDFVGRGEAAERNGRRQLGLALVAEGRGHIGGDGPGRHDVGGDRT